MISIALFALAAVLGIVMAVRHFQGHSPPMPIALSHGFVAALGIAQLMFAGPDGGYSPLWKVALGVFVVVALGGLALFGLHRKKGTLSTPLLVGHGLGAIAAFILLLVAVLGTE